MSYRIAHLRIACLQIARLRTARVPVPVPLYSTGSIEKTFKYISSFRVPSTSFDELLRKGYGDRIYIPTFFVSVTTPAPLHFIVMPVKCLGAARVPSTKFRVTSEYLLLPYYLVVSGRKLYHSW